MIMSYDLLLLDNVCYITEGHDARREQLCSLVRCIPGRADIGSRENIDFSSRRAPEQLREAFARAITQRWEGLVLKGRDDPYYSSSGNNRFIKLKKDYIHGLGDTVDLAVVGGRRDPIDEQELGMGKLRWTSFYIGCLENKNQVCRFDVKPIFRIIDKIDRHGMTKKDILFLNRLGYFEEVPFALSTPKLDVRLERGRLPLPTDLFKRPFIVDVMGAGFDKPANTRFFALRFPRVQKIHQDRTIKDTVGFEELQELARQSMEVPQEEESENRNWLEKLKGPDSTSNTLTTSMNLATSYNLVPKGSKMMNKPGCSDEWRDQKQEGEKVKTDSPLSDGIPFQRSKRTLLLEGSQQVTKRAKVSPITSLHEDSSVTLSANYSVIEPGPESHARNNDQQLGYRAISFTSKETTGNPEQQTVSPHDT
jgi:DNA ligase-4